MPASAARTRTIMEAYWGEGRADDCLREDAVFVMMASGERVEGRAAVVDLLRAFYSEVFDATAEVVSTVVGEGHAVFEGTVIGTHVGAYGDVPPSGRAVRVPLCVCYDVEDDGIAQARIYLMESVLMEQIGA